MTKNSEYQEVCTLTDGSCRSKITRRQRGPYRVQYSFRIFKVYEKDGKQHESNWLDGRHLDSMARLIVKTRERIDLEQERDAQELAS